MDTNRLSQELNNNKSYYYKLGMLTLCLSCLPLITLLYYIYVGIEQYKYWAFGEIILLFIISSFAFLLVITSICGKINSVQYNIYYKQYYIV
jgi:membrane protein YqaA with SNARE-associated domain